MLTVVTGPPCSGKSTHVREHAKPGDIIVDFDLLAQALGSPDTHDHPDPIRYVTAAVRRTAVDAAIRQHQQGATVWVIETHIGRRVQAYEQANATIITLSADNAELHRRANAERPRRWHKLIDEWSPRGAPTRAVTGSREW